MNRREPSKVELDVFAEVTLCSTYLCVSRNSKTSNWFPCGFLWFPIVPPHLQDPRVSLVVGTNVFLPGLDFPRLSLKHTLRSLWIIPPESIDGAFFSHPSEQEWFLKRMMGEQRETRSLGSGLIWGSRQSWESRANGLGLVRFCLKCTYCRSIHPRLRSDAQFLPGFTSKFGKYLVAYRLQPQDQGGVA